MFLTPKEFYDLALKVQTIDPNDEFNIKIDLPGFKGKLFASFYSNNPEINEDKLSLIDLESGDSYSFLDEKFKNIKFELV